MTSPDGAKGKNDPFLTTTTGSSTTPLLPRKARSRRDFRRPWGKQGSETKRRAQQQRATPIKVTKNAASSERTNHSFVFKILNSRSRQLWAQVYKTFITGVIVVDLVFFIASTEPSLKGLSVFHVAEGIASSIFLVEYIARLVTCIESKYFKNFGPYYGRFRYCTSWNAILDALATLPFFIEYFTGIILPTLTYLRVFRLLRILKTKPFSNALDAVVRVIFYNRAILTVALLLCIGLVLTTAVLMYYLRPPGDYSDFQSIGSTMYLATLMLTGQGGPADHITLPWYTKGVVLLTGVFSIGMFAIPASMLTWGFEAEAARLAAAARRSEKHQILASSSSSEWMSDEDSSDEEYQKIIAGEDGTDTVIQQLKQIFSKADIDQSGSLSQAEFIEQCLKGHTTPLRMQGNGQPRDHPLRIDRLEQKVDAIHAKLDTLIVLLQEQANG